MLCELNLCGWLFASGVLAVYTGALGAKNSANYDIGMIRTLYADCS